MSGDHNMYQKDMPTVKDGGPAFPTNDVCYNGMTLRDYFAAKAMQGLLMSTGMWANNEDADLAHSAYQMADAMLKAREQ